MPIIGLPWTSGGNQGAGGAIRIRVAIINSDGALSDIFEFRILPPNDPLQRYVLGFGEDETGEVYLLTSQNLGPDLTTTTGEVFRIVVPHPGGKDGIHHSPDGNDGDVGPKNKHLQSLSKR